MNTPIRFADCHPDQKHYGHGLCRRCWKLNWYKSDKAKATVAVYNKTYNERGRLVRRRTKLLKTLEAFGLTPEDHERMFEQQKGVCGICKKECSSGRRLAIDHKHGVDTIHVRGLLCGSCNTKLGWFERNQQAILDYLVDR